LRQNKRAEIQGRLSAKFFLPTNKKTNKQKMFVPLWLKRLRRTRFVGRAGSLQKLRLFSVPFRADSLHCSSSSVFFYRPGRAAGQARAGGARSAAEAVADPLFCVSGLACAAAAAYGLRTLQGMPRPSRKRGKRFFEDLKVHFETGLRDCGKNYCLAPEANFYQQH
jgi:hypothetical protein